MLMLLTLKSHRITLTLIYLNHLRVHGDVLWVRPGCMQELSQRQFVLLLHPSVLVRKGIIHSKVELFLDNENKRHSKYSGKISQCLKNSKRRNLCGRNPDGSCEMSDIPILHKPPQNALPALWGPSPTPSPQRQAEGTLGSWPATNRLKLLINQEFHKSMSDWFHNVIKITKGKRFRCSVIYTNHLYF